MADAQEQLRAARAGLATALTAALAAVNDPAATPAMVGAAMGGLQQAQQTYNNVIARIPLVVMTDGRLFDGPQQPPEDAPEPARPERAGIIPDKIELLGTTNARKWADTFLAVNKNHALDREALVFWFENAIQAGFNAAAKRFTG